MWEFKHYVKLSLLKPKPLNRRDLDEKCFRQNPDSVTREILEPVHRTLSLW